MLAAALGGAGMVISESIGGGRRPGVTFCGSIALVFLACLMGCGGNQPVSGPSSPNLPTPPPPTVAATM